MGGKTAMALALTSPVSVGNLVVVDIAPVAYADRFTPYVEAMRSIDAAATASRTEAQRRLAERLPDPATAPFLLQNLVSRNDHFDWRLNLAAIGIIGAGVECVSDHAARSPLRGPYFVDPRRRLGLCGRGGPRSLQEPVPGVQGARDRGCGALVHAEKPDAFLIALRQALDRAAP